MKKLAFSPFITLCTSALISVACDYESTAPRGHESEQGDALVADDSAADEAVLEDLELPEDSAQPWVEQEDGIYTLTVNDENDDEVIDESEDPFAATAFEMSVEYAETPDARPAAIDDIAAEPGVKAKSWSRIYRIWHKRCFWDCPSNQQLNYLALTRCRARGWYSYSPVWYSSCIGVSGQPSCRVRSLKYRCWKY